MRAYVRMGMGSWAAVLVLAWPVGAQTPGAASATPSPPSVKQLQDVARAAEQAGQWDTAVAAYCQLYLTDRRSPEWRSKLHQALRRMYQQQRHRDPHYARFVEQLSPTDALHLYTEVISKLAGWYADKERARVQRLWRYGVEELAAALDSPEFRERFLAGAGPERLAALRQQVHTWKDWPVTDAAAARRYLRRLLLRWQEQGTTAAATAMLLEMLCGACSGLDEYTIYLHPAQPTPPDLSAHGIYWKLTNGSLVIERIVPGSWAELHTPLRPGQVISHINGYDWGASIDGWEEVQEALRHDHDGWHELVVVTGDAIGEMRLTLPAVPPSVYGTAVKTGRDGVRVGYLRIGVIRDTTPQELEQAIAVLEQEGARALVLDLRGSMGGSFTAALDVVRRLLPEGVIVTTQGQLPEVNDVRFTSDSGAQACWMPLVVLVDATTASASEMLAAALRDHDRAVLVGMPTFGKGAIQYPLSLQLESEGVERGAEIRLGGVVRLTIAHLVSPAGYPLNGMGVQPHLIEPDPAMQLDIGLRKAAEAAKTTLPMALPPPMMPPAPSAAAPPLMPPMVPLP